MHEDLKDSGGLRNCSDFFFQTKIWKFETNAENLQPAYLADLRYLVCEV